MKRLGNFLLAVLCLAVLLIMLIALLTPAAKGSSKPDAALREQLAAAQAQLAKQELAIARLSSANSARAVEASRQSADQNSDVRLAQNDNAGSAQLAATAAKSQVQTLVITTSAGFLTLILGFAMKAYQDAVNYRHTEEATASHRQSELSKIDSAREAANAEAAKASVSRHSLVAELARLQVLTLKAERALSVADAEQEKTDAS